jgi:protein ImuA
MILNDLKNLAERIAEIERNEHPCRQTAVLVGMPVWEDVLLGGKLGAGSFVELLAEEEGAGAWTLALFMARYACGQRKVLVVADAERRFYPPAASRLGIDLRRTVVIRPKEGKAALAAMTQSLRCAAVGAAIGKLERLGATDCRRLQIAAENGGGVGFILRPAAALNMPSFATVRLLVAPLPVFECLRSGIRQNSVEPTIFPTIEPGILANSATPQARRIQVEVARFRGGKAGHSLVLEIDDEKGHVRLPAGVAAAKSPSPSARASG